MQNVLSSRLQSKNLKIKIYRTIILPVVLYGCETWSLTLKEERRLSMFENRVLRGIFGPKTDEVTGEWRKLHNEELNTFTAIVDLSRFNNSCLKSPASTLVDLTFQSRARSDLSA